MIQTWLAAFIAAVAYRAYAASSEAWKLGILIGSLLTGMLGIILQGWLSEESSAPLGEVKVNTPETFAGIEQLRSTPEPMILYAHLVKGDGQPRPSINAVVGVAGRLAAIPFLVDTGSDMTLLSGRDAQKLGITDDVTDAITVFSGVGGMIQVPTILARITLADEFSPRATEIATPIGLLDRVVEGMPSLLGMDVLQHFDVRLPAA